MGSVYLQPDEYTAHGAPAGTSAADVARASTYIDGWLRRPEGLVWVADAAGNPCHMAARNAEFLLSTLDPISPGTNVPVRVSGPLKNVYVGDALVLDRTNDAAREVVRIVKIDGITVTLDAVSYAHAAVTKLESGLQIKERKHLPRNRPIFRCLRRPLVRMTAGRGRYSYPRRGDANAGVTDQFNMLAVYSTFGGPPYWEIIQPNACEFDGMTGNIWIPAGIMLAYYTEMEVTYVSGFSADCLPDQVKDSCARIIAAMKELPNIPALKSYRAGDTAIERFADKLIDELVGDQLKPYRAIALA